MRLIATTLSLVASTTLLMAGVSHLHQPRHFRKLLRKQEVWPHALEWPIVALTAGSEIVLGVICTGIALGAIGQGSPSLLGASALYFCYGTYSFFLLSIRPAAPCACSGEGDLISPWVVTRAYLLSLFASIGWLFQEPIGFTALTGVQVGTVMCATISIAIVIWSLPMALGRHQEAVVGL